MLRDKHKSLVLSEIEQSEVSPLFANLLQELLKADPRDRLGWKGGFTEIKSHPWFTQEDIHWEELTQPGSREILSHPDSTELNLNVDDAQEEGLCRRLVKLDREERLWRGTVTNLRTFKFSSKPESNFASFSGPTKAIADENLIQDNTQR